MSQFQPPPTWALPILVDERTKRAQFNPIWLKWFVDLAQVLSSVNSGVSSSTGFSGVSHNLLSGLQGGMSGEYYHLTAAEYASLAGAQAFPVGAIFTTINPANPATTLGYGAWSAFAKGRVLVGVDPLDPDFDTVEETGGSKTAPCC